MKRGIQFAGVMLLALALACLYVGQRAFLRSVRQQRTKIWECILFLLIRLYPTQVKKIPPAAARDSCIRRTVYLVYYRATDGSGYQWKDEVQYRNAAEKMVAAEENVERRVLSIRESGKYITVEGDQTTRGVTYSTSSGAAGNGLAFRCLFGCIWLCVG